MGSAEGGKAAWILQLEDRTYARKGRKETIGAQKKGSGIQVGKSTGNERCQSVSDLSDITANKKGLVDWEVNVDLQRIRGPGRP